VGTAEPPLHGNKFYKPALPNYEADRSQELAATRGFHTIDDVYPAAESTA